MGMFWCCGERKMKKELTGTFTQYPLETGMGANTIHKSQGMTFDKLSLDLSRGCSQLANSMWHSAVYVHWKVFISQKTLFPQYAHTSREVRTYASEYNNEQQIDNEIESVKAVYSALQQNDHDEAKAVSDARDKES